MTFSLKNSFPEGTMRLSNGYSHRNDQQGQFAIRYRKIKANRSLENDLKECLPLSYEAEIKEWYKNGGMKAGYHPAQKFREKELKLIDCIGRLYGVNDTSQSSEESDEQFFSPQKTAIQREKENNDWYNSEGGKIIDSAADSIALWNEEWREAHRNQSSDSNAKAVRLSEPAEETQVTNMGKLVQYGVGTDNFSTSV